MASCYHGRVLDYMTEIGLQDAATTFVISADGQIPFANVGYAGFIGSVSGMNAEAISLGEMGGKGEGHWDGVPMATLMRRALEECDTLDEVMQLWTDEPAHVRVLLRVCRRQDESRRGCGGGSRVDRVHSAGPDRTRGWETGSRTLWSCRPATGCRRCASVCRRSHGQFDAELGMWLMSRPVAMKSNLHNVLFVPQDGVLYVANADHKHCAAERPYVRLDLRELLAELPAAANPPAAPSTVSPPQ